MKRKSIIQSLMDTQKASMIAFEGQNMQNRNFTELKQFKLLPQIQSDSETAETQVPHS